MYNTRTSRYRTDFRVVLCDCEATVDDDSEAACSTNQTDHQRQATDNPPPAVNTSSHTTGVFLAPRTAANIQAVNDDGGGVNSHDVTKAYIYGKVEQ